MASRKQMGGETIQVDGEDLENYLDVRLYYMKELGKCMQRSTEAEDPYAELRVYKRWLNMIRPWTHNTRTQKIEEDIKKAKAHLAQENMERAKKKFDTIHKNLYRAKPSLYFPAKPSRETGDAGFDWEDFLKGKPPYSHHRADTFDNRGTDFFLEKWMLRLRKRLTHKDDDYMIICTGDAGTGKSSLSLHAYEYYADKPSIKAFGLNRSDHARSLDYARQQEQYRFSCNDEAQVKGRDAMKKYNRDLIDLYLQKRGKNIFDWWNNPQVAILDKPFFDGPVDALIYIFEDQNDKPRHYAVFTASQITSWMEQNERLTLSFLQSKIEEAWYIGWFRDYQGSLRKAYDEKKEQKMDSTMDSFIENYGDEEIYSMVQAAEEANVHRKTFKKYLDRLDEEGELEKGEDYKVTPTGTYQIPKDTIDYVAMEIKEYNS